jgi:hypothetical protein
MAMKLLGVMGAILLGVLANDIWALSAPLARRTVVLAARLWARDQEQADVLAEEWRAYIDDRPGQVLKLLTASAFLLAAVGRLMGRRFTARSRRIKPVSATSRWRLAKVSARAANAVPIGLLVGLLSSVSLLVFYLIGLDTAWAVLVGGVGVTVAVAAVVTSIIYGFLARPPAHPTPDTASLAALARILNTQPDTGHPSPAHPARLVRPFIDSSWRHCSSQPGLTGLVRPYIPSDSKPTDDLGNRA